LPSRRDTIKIANCGGFWGDDPTAARRQVRGGPIDYLVMDYLAEVTMAILQKQRSKDPSSGYARDFLVQLRDVLVPAVEGGIRIITNAGGVNPKACGAAVERLAAELGVADRVKVAVIDGDDIFPSLQEVVESGEQLVHMDTGRPLREAIDTVLSANVYVGAAPIVKALDMGANVIVAGRVTDTGVTLAPMIHEFGWAADDWDRLAAGIVAGHIIECGTQCTGGNFTDWQTVPEFANIGYPIVEASSAGAFVVTKHPGTGGIVNVHTVSEQLLYEMGAPAYLSPDCIAHFDSIRLSDDGPDRVRVTGIKGDPPPERLKVAVSYAEGYRAVGRVLVSGPHALTKAEKARDIFWQAAGGTDFYDHTLTQFVGWDAAPAPLSSSEPGEVLLQFSARDLDRAKIETHFAPMVVGRLLGSVPGFTIPSDQGRPRASEVVGHWPALISRDRVQCRVQVGDDTYLVANDACAYSAIPDGPGQREAASFSGVGAAGGETVTVPLLRLCLGRSGDKGDTANIGVIARSPAIYEWILHNLTADVVKQHFKGVCLGEVERFALDNLQAMNFLLHESLGGGGTLSLRFDAQGKTFAQFLLGMAVEVPLSLLGGP
jgi:hypothetical protein